MSALCIAPGCAARGRHHTTCQRDDCAGCLPRLAADGLRLCHPHVTWLANDATELPRLYDALGLALRGAGGSGEHVTRSADGSPGINTAAADARHAIRNALTTWCRLIADERGLGLPVRTRVEERPPGFVGPLRLLAEPDDRLRSLGAYLARHAEWLAASDYADEVVPALRDLAHGLPYRIAYPGGARKYPLALPDGSYAACPEQVAPEGTPGPENCPGTLWTILRRDASLLPSEIACNHDEQHRWPTSRWIKLGARLLTEVAA